MRDITSDELMLIFHEGRFLTESLEAVDPTTLSDNQPMVLAVSPDVPLNTLLHIQQMISSPNLSIAPLSEEWISTLEQL